MSISVTRRLVVSLISAVLVALTAHLVAVLAFFIAKQFQFAAIPAASDYFALPTILAFILVFVVVLVTEARSRVVTFVASLVAGVLAVLISTFLSAMASGQDLSLQVWGQIFATLGDVPLLFWLTVGVGGVTIGVAVYRGLVTSSASEGTPMAFVRIPSERFAAADERQELDQQWDDLIGALSAAGVIVDEVAGDDTDTAGALIGDRVRIFGSKALIFGAGAKDTALADQLAHERYRVIAAPDGAENLSAANVVVADKRVFVATGQDAAGLAWLRETLSPEGYVVTAVPGPLTAPLASLVCALPDGTVLVSAAFNGPASIFGPRLALPEVTGAHSFPVVSTTVFVPASAPETAELIRSCGYTVVTADVAGFARLGVLPGSLAALS